MSRISFIKGYIAAGLRNLASNAGISGNIYTLSHRLGPTSTFSKVSGNANLTVSGGSVNAASIIPNGQTQTIVIREVFGTLAQEYAIVFTGTGATIPQASLKFNIASNGGYIALFAESF